MDEIVRYVTVFEKKGEELGKPILASSDPDAVSECVRVLADRAQNPAESGRVGLSLGSLLRPGVKA